MKRFLCAVLFSLAAIPGQARGDDLDRYIRDQHRKADEIREDTYRMQEEFDRREQLRMQERQLQIEEERLRREERRERERENPLRLRPWD